MKLCGVKLHGNQVLKVKALSRGNSEQTSAPRVKPLPLKDNEDEIQPGLCPEVSSSRFAQLRNRNAICHPRRLGGFDELSRRGWPGARQHELLTTRYVRSVAPLPAEASRARGLCARLQALPFVFTAERTCGISTQTKKSKFRQAQCPPWRAGVSCPKDSPRRDLSALG